VTKADEKFAHCGPVEHQWLNAVNQIWRQDNLVYVNHPKCASWYFFGTFQRNQWQSGTFEDIRWGQDQVFGFIMDPVTKYLKGITQDFWDWYPDRSEEMLSHLGIWIKHQAFVGWHNMPLSMRLHKYMYQVHWFPLDLPDIKAMDLVQGFLQHHGQSVTFEGGDTHVSNPAQIEIYNRVKEKFGDLSATTKQLLAKDIDLYKQVCACIDARGQDWKEIYQYQPCYN
jgi:hypothetical protein